MHKSGSKEEELVITWSLGFAANEKRLISIYSLAQCHNNASIVRKCGKTFLSFALSLRKRICVAFASTHFFRRRLAGYLRKDIYIRFLSPVICTACNGRLEAT